MKMNKLVINEYIDYLNNKFKEHKKNHNHFETKKAFSNFSLFGSYGSSHRLILGCENDIEKYSRTINVTLSENEVKNYYSKFGTIVLRPYQGERDFIIGCGNIIKYFGEC